CHYRGTLYGSGLCVCAAVGQRTLRDRAMGGGRCASAVAGATIGDYDRRLGLCAYRDATCPGVGADSGSCDIRKRNVSTNVNFPYQVEGGGRTLDPLQDYVRQLVEQVLFTSPGERVNLPDFGSGLLQLPFAPNSIEMAAAAQVNVQAALQKWLSGYIKVLSV